MGNARCGYTAIAYPESIPWDWETALNKLPFGYCYALHDRDVDEYGELKKPHMHFFFQGVPEKKQIKYIWDNLGVQYGEYVRSISGMFEYLTHENNPDKFHYPRDIIQFSAKWCQEAFDMKYVPHRDTDAEIYALIKEQNILEYFVLQDECYKIGDKELMRAANNHKWVAYLNSKRNALHQQALEWNRGKHKNAMLSPFERLQELSADCDGTDK